MKKIGIISDTHGYIDNQILRLFNDCDQVWHAGDIGYNNNINGFISKHNIRGVYGNIDGSIIRTIYPKNQKFQCEGIRVLMTHIGGYPKKYTPEIEKVITLYKPHLYICGHSHILKIIYDKKYNLLHINPGAAGKEGFHKMRTMITLNINLEKIFNIQVVELGLRGSLS